MTPGIPFSSILIHGMGMMGASLALALRESAGFHGKITGVVRSEKSAAFIRAHKLADDVLIGDDAALDGIAKSTFDLVILGLPVRRVIETIARFPAYKGLITDMSSTRLSVEEAASKRPDLRFKGAHPMCGSENAGPSAAKPELYRDRLCILTHLSQAKESDDDAAIDSFWKAVGMRTFRMEAADHDHVLAFLSHAPHFLSGILALWAHTDPNVASAIHRAPMPVTGGGFRDMARIAGSNPEMWEDILLTNRPPIARALRDFRRQLDQIIENVESGNMDWKAWFQSARRARNQLCGYPEES